MAMIKSKKLNEKELKKYLNNYGVAKHLKFFASMLCDKKFNLRLNFGGGSYTDWKTVFIGIPKYLVNHTKEEVLSTGKAETAHEIEHINSTPYKEYQDFINEFAKYFKDTHDINEGIGKKVGGFIINSLEDGRIERLSCEKFPGVTKHLVFFRGMWWQNNEISGKDELMDTLFCLCTFATMGLYPKGYADAYEEKEELYEMIRGVKKHIMKFVNSDDFDKGIPHVWDVVHQIEEWMVELMKAIPEPELSDKFDKANEDFSEIGEGFGDSSSSPSPSSESEEDEEEKESAKGKGAKEETDDEEESSSDVHKAFNPKNEKEDGTPSGSDNIGDLDSGEEVDADRSMDSIIEEAMRNFEQEIHEEEYENVIQADFDDILENKRIEEEKAKEEGLSDSEKEEITDFYKELDSSKRDGNWAKPLKIHRYNYDKVDAPQSIKLESKRLEKEFATILLNKRSMNSRNRKRGMLDTNALWKVQNKDYNIFQKKGNPNDTDYVFYILVDGSGSMWGDKFKQAYKATSLLEEALGKFVPLKITQFDAEYSNVNHYVVKDFEQNKGNYSWSFVNNNRPGNCNMDGYSIRVALKELQKRNERKKVLIILSDGQPSGDGNYYGRYAKRDVKEAIRDGRKDGIHIFNIMFGDEYSRKGMIEDFKFMYEKGIVSCEPEKIATELLRLVKKELNN